MQAAENTKIWSSRRYTGEQVVCTYVLGDTFPRFFDVQRTLPKQGKTVACTFDPRQYHHPPRYHPQSVSRIGMCNVAQ